jgi:uncharacterized membrane protein HdeD (DUF308 family)
MTSISDVFATGLAEVKKVWSRFFVLGILLVILGATCIVKAQAATTYSILALGWVLMISGAIWLINSFFAVDGPIFFLYLMNALLRGGVGYLLIRHRAAGAEGVTMVLAVLFVIGGLFRTIGASVIRFPLWGLAVVAGLVSIGLGIFLMANWSTASTFFVGIVIGVDLLFDGAALMAFAGALHRLPTGMAGTHASRDR